MRTLDKSLTIVAVLCAASVWAAEPTTLPKLVDLGADKCIPCKMMAPILKELKAEYAGRMDVEFIDVWKNPDAGRPYKIKLIPTQIFFDASGKERFRHEGFFGKEDILAKWKELGVDVKSEGRNLHWQVVGKRAAPPARRRRDPADRPAPCVPSRSEASGSPPGASFPSAGRRLCAAPQSSWPRPPGVSIWSLPKFAGRRRMRRIRGADVGPALASLNQIRSTFLDYFEKNDHEVVAESAAIGVPSELSEEEEMVVVVLKEGAALYPHHLRFDYDFDTALAVVAQHPQRADLWGLRNMTDRTWSLRLPGGDPIEERKNGTRDDAF